MKKFKEGKTVNKIFIAIFFIFVSSSLFAYDWSKHNLTVVKSEKKDNEIFVTLKTSENTVFTLRYRDEISGSTVDKILKLNSRLRRWEYMTVKSIEFVAQKASIQVAVFPEKYAYNKTDFMPYMPAGMMFIQRESLKYNFRITVQNNFIRIKGDFLNEKLLSEKIGKAIEDPIGYISTYNPRYLLRKILENENGLQKLKKEYKELSDRHEKLKNAVMTLHNTGFMGFGVTEIKKNVIKRIIELKKENPKITQDQISDKLSEEKIKASSKEIFLILSVYFNEFE